MLNRCSYLSGTADSRICCWCGSRFDSKQRNRSVSVKNGHPHISAVEIRLNISTCTYRWPKTAWQPHLIPLSRRFRWIPRQVKVVRCLAVLVHNNGGRHLARLYQRSPWTTDFFCYGCLEASTAAGSLLMKRAHMSSRDHHHTARRCRHPKMLGRYAFASATQRTSFRNSTRK